MKILKIFGVVVGIHVFALILIFANPGCSSPNKPAPSAADTVVAPAEPAATVSLPSAGTVSPVSIAGGDAVVSAAPAFDPNAPAPAVRFSPTRPGTPAATALESQPVGDVTPASTYSVAKGDSLWTIAKKHHISVGDLAAANNLKASSTVRLGQKLIIPGGKLPPGTGGTVAADRGNHAAPASEPAAAPARRSYGESVKHVVKPGETLGAIARKYQVRIGEIATANNITDPARIRPGMELTIPGWQAPAAKSAKGGTGGTPRPTPEIVTDPAAPSVVTPAPEQDLDAGLKKASDTPVIKVDDKP
jgi:LysM repeat protein